MELTRESIVNLLSTNDKAVARALVVLKNNQTADERTSETTRHANGMGFRPAHARMGTSMATFYEKFGKLSEKQIAYWRAKDVKGNMRIAIYWRQLIEAANNKTAS